VGLDDFQKYFCKGYNKEPEYVLIDIANGHQEQLVDLIKKTKKICYNTKIMVGNVANPLTYVELSKAGADYIRIGLGMGSACLTTEQTGVGYPMASLIKDVYEESLSLKTPAKIVADGGIRKYSDIIKSLGLGADAVMIGGVFNKALESSGDTYLWKTFKVDQYSSFGRWLYKHDYKLYKKFRGMSTKEVQQELGNKQPKTSEGIVKYNEVRWEIEGWTENFRHYLRSAMSYCGAKTLNDFIGKVDYNIISTNAYKRFNK
jgi:IMP dehydrogenase/GMP reductase